MKNKKIDKKVKAWNEYATRDGLMKSYDEWADDVDCNWWHMIYNALMTGYDEGEEKA